MVRMGIAVCALGIVCVSGGCGGDDGNGSAVSTGLPPGKVLADLSEAEAQEACNSFADGVRSVLSPSRVERMSCTLAAGPMSLAVVDGKAQVDVAMCQELTDRCMSGESIGDGEGPEVDFDFDDDDIECDSAMIESDLADCTITVSEFEGCINAMLAEFDAIVGSVTCSAFEDPEALEARFGEDGPDLSSLPQCAPLRDNCPGIDLFGGDEERVEISR